MADRWFFALWPDAAARVALSAGAARLLPPGGRAVDSRDLHLTLIFLGPLSPEDLAAAVHAAQSVRAKPISLCIDRSGYFPRPRALWCGPAEPWTGLLDLYRQLRCALSDRGLLAESRPYRPHITLARKVCQDPGQTWGPPVEWTSRELTLARGLENRVPRYDRRYRWPLVDDAPTDSDPVCPL